MIKAFLYSSYCLENKIWHINACTKNLAFKKQNKTKTTSRVNANIIE